MDIKDIITLIQTVSDSKLTSFEYQEGETRLAFQVAREIETIPFSSKMEVQTNQNVETENPIEEQEFNYITSPMVGTFYSCASEDSKPFIKVGDVIEAGQVIGIVEAMKLMNEVESPFSGVVEEILVSNQEMVGYDQILVRVRP